MSLIVKLSLECLGGRWQDPSVGSFADPELIPRCPHAGRNYGEDRVHRWLKSLVKCPITRERKKVMPF